MREREIPTITVDLAKKCTRCNSAGATGSGLCLMCVAKIIAEGAKRSRKDKRRQIDAASK